MTKSTATAKKAKKSETTTADLEADLGTHKASAEELKAVETVVLEAITLKTRIEKGEALLKELKSNLAQTVNEKLPAILAQAGTSLYKVDSGPLQGWKVEVVPIVAGSLPQVTKEDDTDEKIASKKAKRSAGLNWLRKAGLEDIIKTELVIRFDKGQDNLMGDVKGYAEKLGLAPDIESGVHHATLCSAMKEYIKTPDPEVGEPPFEDLGLFAGRAAKLTAPKETK